MCRKVGKFEWRKNKVGALTVQITFRKKFRFLVIHRLHTIWSMYLQIVMRNRYSLVNVNNNNITIVFLKMILSFSDVILANLSLPRPSLHSTNISWYTIQFSRADEIERWKVPRWLLRTKSKVLSGIGWEFFRNFAWFGSFIHGEKESEVCLAFSSKDINLLSWIKMRLVKMFFFVFPLVQEALFIEHSMIFFILGGFSRAQNVYGLAVTLLI